MCRARGREQGQRIRSRYLLRIFARPETPLSQLDRLKSTLYRPRNQRLIGDVDQDDLVDLDPREQGGCLVGCAGEAVEQVAVLAILLLKALIDNSHN